MYTIGYIGSHKIVSTKLPALGRQMAAQISSGNTTTRLLGMNQFNIYFVFSAQLLNVCAFKPLVATNSCHKTVQP